MNQPTTNPLTVKELKRYRELNAKFFQGSSFVVFSKEEEASKEFKEMDGYTKRILECRKQGKPIVCGTLLLAGDYPRS